MLPSRRSPVVAGAAAAALRSTSVVVFRAAALSAGTPMLLADVLRRARRRALEHRARDHRLAGARIGHRFQHRRLTRRPAGSWQFANRRPASEAIKQAGCEEGARS